MKSFHSLVRELSPEKLAFLCRLSTIVGREMLVTENVYDLMAEDLVKVSGPLIRGTGSVSGFCHSYKLTARGARFLSRLRTEGNRGTYAGS